MAEWRKLAEADVRAILGDFGVAGYQAHHPIAVGTMVDLVLNFPDLDASIAVTGEVVWANREPPMDMGIRYVDLDEERKDTLRKYINMVRK